MLGALIALACVNSTLELFDPAARLREAEAQIEVADLATAREVLTDMQFLGDTALRMRALDLQALLKLRAPKPRARARR